MMSTATSAQEILQEEMFRERAAVLAKAGERVALAMGELRRIGDAITRERAAWPLLAAGRDDCGSATGELEGDTGWPAEMRAMIRAYNFQREELRERYYDLIVTREAMGIVHHQRLAEIYRIPPRMGSPSER